LYSWWKGPIRKEYGDDEMSGLSVGSYRDRPERGPPRVLHASGTQWIQEGAEQKMVRRLTAVGERSSRSLRSL
jgi:hypothetical protein